MKTFRWTMVAAVFAAALVAFVVWDTQRSEKAEADKEKNQQVLKISQDEISRIEVVGNGVLTKLEKNGTAWKLLSPVEDLADEQAVLGILSSLSSEKSRETVAEGEGIDEKIYGLDQPMLTAKFAGGGHEQELKIGSVKSYDSNLYGEIAGDKKVLLLGPTWETQLLKPVRDLRNKRLYRTEGEFKPESVEVSLGQTDHPTSFKLVKGAKGGWDIQGVKNPLPIAEESVRQFTEDVRDLRANDFIEADKDAPGARAKHGLQKPAIKIVLKNTGAKNAYELLIAPSKTGNVNVPAVSSDVRDVASVMMTAVGRINKSPEDFFDKKIPFAFDAAQAHRLIIKSAAFSGEFVKSGNNWASADKGLQNAPDSAKLTELVNQVAKLEAARFLGADMKGAELKKPSSIELRDEKGSKLFELVWGEKVNGKVQGGAEVTYHPARTNKTDRVITLAPTSIANLKLEDLKPPPATPPPQGGGKAPEASAK